MNDLNKALEIATLAHKGQVDKVEKDYINHPIAVSNMCTTLESKIVGLLHDTVEDTYITLEYLSQFFTSDIIEAIRLLTKTYPLDIDKYYKDIKANKIAKEVKLADLTHNMDMSRFDGHTVTLKDIDRREKYKKYYEYLNKDDTMDNIKIYRFFSVNKKASLYVFNKVNEGNKKLDKLAKEYIKKYSDTNLFDVAAKREKNLHYLIFKDNKYVGEIYFDILRYFKQLYINFIHIDPNYQRQGLSKILFNYVVNDVKANFKKIKTIQGYPTSIEGKYFLESTGFIPDVYYCSSGSKGQYSIYYLNEKDTFILDQKEYELVCGNTYNYRVNGVKRYNKLVNAQKEIDPDFSAKNYEYFLKHNKVKKEIVKPIINSSIFTIDDCDLDDIMPLSTSKEEVIKEKVPSIFTQEYIDTYMDKME